MTRNQRNNFWLYLIFSIMLALFLWNGINNTRNEIKEQKHELLTLKIEHRDLLKEQNDLQDQKTLRELDRKIVLLKSHHEFIKDKIKEI